MLWDARGVWCILRVHKLFLYQKVPAFLPVFSECAHREARATRVVVPARITQSQKRAQPPQCCCVRRAERRMSTVLFVDKDSVAAACGGAILERDRAYKHISWSSVSASKEAPRFIADSTRRGGVVLTYCLHSAHACRFFYYIVSVCIVENVVCMFVCSTL